MKAVLGLQEMVGSACRCARIGRWHRRNGRADSGDSPMPTIHSAEVEEPLASAAGGTSSEKRMPALDGLRALSIAFVLLGHVSGTHGGPKLELERVMGDYANLGLVMFFALSRLLLPASLL